MPNVKISQLPTLGAGFIDTIFPVVNGGTTYQMSFQDLSDTLAPGGIQDASSITQSIYVDGASLTKFPSAAAVKTYADGLVTGLLSDRGNYTPGLVSPGAFPSTGGRGPAGIPAKGDLWFVAANGFLGTTAVTTGQSVRALIDAPGQTAANWDILDVAGFTVPPEDSTNKVTSKANFIADGSSIVKYPSIKAVKDYIDTEVTLQDVITNNNALTDNNNLQGLSSGSAMTPGVTDINAFGESAASGNGGSIVNAIGKGAANSNTGDSLNAIGRDAAINNSGTYVDAIGLSAANTNSGSTVVAIGREAAKQNTKNNVIGLGYQAAMGNTGNNLNSIGAGSGKNNTGADCNFIGFAAGQDQTGNNVISIGSQSGVTNVGNNLISLGLQSGSDNSGSNVISVGFNSGASQSGNNVTFFGSNAGVGNTYNNVVLFGPSAAADGNSQLVWVNELGNSAKFDANSLTAGRKITLPDASGTMPLSVNGNTPNPLTGDITITTSNSLPYDVYAAFLTFSSGGITATQLYNTIGDGSGDGINDIAWSYGIGGWYQAQMSAGVFSAKTAIIPGGYIGNGQYIAITGTRVSSSQINVFGVRPSDNSYVTAYVSGVYVEIRIYP